MEKIIKKIFALLLSIVLIFSLVGCAKCISTEYKNVEVTVVDKYHRSAYITFIQTGKSTIPITHPAVWSITVEYNDVKYTVGGYDTYNKYKDKTGQTTTGELEIKTYDDGTIKYNIVSLE